MQNYYKTLLNTTIIGGLISTLPPTFTEVQRPRREIFLNASMDSLENNSANY